jgi:hypothetical protein
MRTVFFHVINQSDCQCLVAALNLGNATFNKEGKIED